MKENIILIRHYNKIQDNIIHQTEDWVRLNVFDSIDNLTISRLKIQIYWEIMGKIDFVIKNKKN